MATLFYESDTDASIISSKTVAIIGFGSQGHAHARNLHESGVKVVVGLREGSRSRVEAEEAGLTVLSPVEAAKVANVVMMLVPDQHMADLYTTEIAPNLEPGDALFFAARLQHPFRRDRPARVRRRRHGRS